MFSTEFGFHLFLKWQLGWEVNTKFGKFLLSFSPLDLYFKGYCKSANSAYDNLYIASGLRISAIHQNRDLRRKTIVYLLCYTKSIPIISTQVQDVQINTEMIKNNIPGHERYPAWETSSVPGVSGTDPQRWVVSAANALKIKIFNVSLYIVYTQTETYYFGSGTAFYRVNIRIGVLSYKCRSGHISFATYTKLNKLHSAMEIQ